MRSKDLRDQLNLKLIYYKFEMEIKTSIASAVTPYRLMFFFSQILYQSIECYRGSDETKKNYSLRELTDVFPDSLIELFIMCMLLWLCYGWVVFFFYRRITIIMDLAECIGLPLAYMFLPPLSMSLGVGPVLLRVFPIIILTISTCAKLYFTVFLYDNLCLNELVKADVYYPIFSIFRLCCLTVTKNFVSPGSLIYVIVVMQFISSLYKYFHILYHNPETQWCSMVTEIWGWLSVVQWALLIYDMRFLILNLALIPIGLMVFRPNARLLVFLESKVKKLMKRAERQRSKEHYIYVLIYYVHISVKGQRKYLSKLWSNSFRHMIHTKISQKDARLNKYLSRVKQTPLINQNLIKQEHCAGQFDNSMQKSRMAVQVKSLIKEEDAVEEVDIQFIKNITKEKIVPSTKFVTSYYILYLLIDSELLDPIFLYQVYYQIFELIKISKQEIQTIQMDNVFNILRSRAPAHCFSGKFVQQILQYNQVHQYLNAYVKNEKKFYALFSETQMDLLAYRAYLDQKIKMKAKIRRCMKVLEFMYPHNESLVMKNYIIERRVNNNQILSEERLIINISRLNAHKTRMVSFTTNSRANEDCVFVCSFLQNRGQITHRNKKFDNILESSNVHRLKLKDILPAYWRDSHDMKVQQLYNLEELHEHNNQSYYLQSLVSHRYFEAKQLVVIPYFELQGEMLLLVRIRIDEVKCLQIRELQVSKDKKPVHTHKIINLKSRSSISNMLEVDEAEKSNKNVKIKEEDLRLYDLEEKSVCIFNKQYLVEAKTNYLNLKTRNLIQSKLEVNITQDIEAIMKVGTKLNDKKLQIIEKNKTINILRTITVPFMLLVMVCSLLFAGGATSISTSFVSYNVLITESAIMKLEYYQVSMGITSFFQVFKTFNCDLDLNAGLGSDPELAKNYQKISNLMPADLVKLQNIYDRHVQFTRQLSKYDGLIKPVFGQYFGRDMQLYKENKNILEHISMMSIMLHSTSKLISSGKCSNWIVRNFYNVIDWQGDLLFDPSYLEYIVTIETDKLLTNQIKQSEVVFWLMEFFNVFSPILAYFIFWRSKCRIQAILTKPLNMDVSQKNGFRANFKSIEIYVNKQQGSSEEKTENHLVSNNSIAEISTQKESQLNLVDSSKKEPRIKNRKGSFLSYVFPLTLLVAFHVLTVVVCSKKLFVAKSQFISTLESKLKKFEEFANFNSQLFIMYDNMLRMLAYPQQFTPEERKQQLSKIDRLKAKLNEVEINDLVTGMLIDSSRSKQILFGNPCQYINLCASLNHTVSAYPTELSLFFTSFHKLQNMYSDPAMNKQKMSVLLYETYVSARALAEMIFHINSINLELVNNITAQNDVWIAVSYVGYGLFLITMLTAVVNMVTASAKYGCQVLSILPSRALCRSKILEFEVNCIYYGTNFAQNRITI